MNVINHADISISVSHIIEHIIKYYVIKGPPNQSVIEISLNHRESGFYLITSIKSVVTQLSSLM